MQLNEHELDNIIGGAISASFINALIRGINILLSLGRSVGSAIRRTNEHNVCKID